MTATLHLGDMLAVLPTIPDASIDAVVTDPPYHLTTASRYAATTLDNENDSNSRRASNPAKADALARLMRGFMGKHWDGGDVAFRPETWRHVWRVMKPGAHLVAFGGTRTYHRMTVAIEDAGFEIRDQLAWIYGTGFPKSHDVAKAIDAALGTRGGKIATGPVERRIRPGADRIATGSNARVDGEFQAGTYVPATDLAAQWNGWGSALKPALEPIVLARKPLIGTIAANVLAHGTGGLNIDACRIEAPEGVARIEHFPTGTKSMFNGIHGGKLIEPHNQGRFPANLLHDGSPDVLAVFPETKSGGKPASRGSMGFHGGARGQELGERITLDQGSAARFFYSAKADKADRAGSKHPTVKPVDLKRWLCRLITPPGGTVLDPFAGTGTTIAAALAEGFHAVAIEAEREYFFDMQARLGVIPPRHYDLFGPLQPWDSL
jgi:DNA modification methylase